MFAPLLSAINVAGGGIPFAAPMSDGGYAARSSIASGGFSQEQLEAAIAKAVSSVKMYVTVEDIRKADANYSKVEARGSN